MDIQEVEQEFKEIVNVLKSGKNEKKEYYPGYNEICRQYERICVHSDEGVFPKELYEHRSPNQTLDELEWTKKNHKQITLPVFLDYQNTRGRAWHNTNWSISYADEDRIFKDNTFRKYVEVSVPYYGSVLNFVTNIMPSLKTKDPNGVVVIKPKDYDYVETETGLKLDENKLFDPAIYYYNCKKVVGYDEDEYCFIEKDEKSIVEFGGQKKQIGLIYEAHTTDAIYRITQVGKFTEYTFVIELEFKHNWGQMLVTRLGGLPKLINNKLVYESPFIFAVDNLDLALLDSANLIASKSKCVYPVRVMVGSECDFKEGDNFCRDGKIFYEINGVAAEKTCPKCNGSGLKNRISPMGDLLWSADGLQDKQNGYEIMKYVSPETHTLTFLDEQINKYIANARRILHMSTTNDVANSNSTTATVNNLENKALMAFVKSVAEQEFDLYFWILNAIGYVRYGDKYKAPTIVKPISFDFTTEEDYLQLLKIARESGATPVIIRQILIKYITSIYFTDKNSSNAFSLLIACDVIIEKNSAEIDMLLAQGIVTKEQVIVHNSGINIIQDLYQNNPSFFEQDFEVQKTQVFEEASKMVVETPVQTDILNAE